VRRTEERTAETRGIECCSVQSLVHVPFRAHCILAMHTVALALALTFTTARNQREGKEG
jgi:hypothetical protein